MFGWLQRIFRPRNKFDLDPARRRMRPVRVRLFAPGDFETCIDLYRLNEPDRFPPGILPQFERSLQDGTALYLVIEDVGRVIACGGVYVVRAAHIEIGFLSFGLVHPERHNQGFGTTLLLARLALLPEDVSVVALLPVPASESFYRRFGFRERGRVKATDGNAYLAYAAPVCRDDLEECRILLDRAGVQLPEGDIAVPVREV